MVQARKEVGAELAHSGNLSVPEAASQLGISEATIRAWIWRRRIAYRKIGRAVRIPQSEIDRINKEGMRPALEGR